MAFNMSTFLLKKFFQFHDILFLANERINAWNFQAFSMFSASCNFTSYCSSMSKEKPEIFCQFSGSMANNRASFQQTNSMTIVRVSVFTIYRDNLTNSWAPHAFVNMMATNDALVEKDSVILHLKFSKQNI